jgi:sulfur relay protein TusB/DsrH
MPETDHRNCQENTAASCLHLVVGAGSEALQVCLGQVAATDSVLFLDAGVLHLLRASADSLAGSAAAVYFGDADLRAHGLLELARRAQLDVLDDAGFCDLLAAHTHCLTWT